MADNLPPSLITEVLSKLPAKSLLRFRCVSKQWKSTIDDHHFIKLHLKHSLQTITNHSIILLRGFDLYCLDFPALKNVTKINHPFQNDKPSLAVSGSCNGLLLLVDRNVEQHPIIYNPTTQQTRMVPSSKIQLPFIEVKDFPFEELLVYGFGYDQVNDDYKVLRIAQVVLVSAHKFYDEVKVYSLKTNSWKRVKGLCDEYVRFMSRHCGVYVNGCLHWIVAKNPVNEFDSLLVAFDLGSCEWKYVEQPKYSDARFGGSWTAVGVLGGCLSVACNYPKDRSEVWVMKEYGVEKSWTKILTLSKTMIRGSVNRVLPIAYSKDRSKVLIVQEDRLKLFWFDLRRQTIESVKIPGVAKIFVMVSGMLVESLVSLKSEEETKPKGKSSGKLDGFLSKGFKLKL